MELTINLICTRLINFIQFYDNNSLQSTSCKLYTGKLFFSPVIINYIFHKPNVESSLNPGKCKETERKGFDKN